MIGPQIPKSEYDIPLFRFKKIKNHMLVANDLGGWALLTPDEFGLFRTYQLKKDGTLFKLLINSGLINTEGNTEKLSK